jgi:flagellar hook-associated protein 1 FlgK
VFDAPQAFDPAIGLGSSRRLATYAGEFTSYQGNATARLTADAEYQRSLVSTLTSRLGDERGVDMDKELQDALLFEKTYSASATVLQVAGRMLDELLAAV